MNGKKILEELIKLFLVINIVLLVINYACRANEYLLSQESIHNIEKLLEMDGIKIDTELLRNFAPKYSANLMFMGDSVVVRDTITKHFYGNQLVNVKRYTQSSTKHPNEKALSFALGDEKLTFDNNELVYNNNAMISDKIKPSVEQAKNMCMKLLRRIDSSKVRKKYYIVTEEEKNSWKITYYPTLDGIPILDSYMEFEVYADGVAKASLYLADVQIRSGGKQDIYSVDLVLFGIEDFMLENNYKRIKEVTICYKQAENEENVLGQQIIPAYKVEIEGLEEPIFVNAYTNEMLK